MNQDHSNQNSKDKCKIILVTGPSNSGKSRWAEHLISEYEPITYIATAIRNKSDHEWENKLRLHSLRRPDHWNLVETSANLSESIQTLSHHLIIDSLGGFVSANLEKTEKEWDVIVDEFLTIINNYSYTVVIVTEETGWSLIPITNIGRIFSQRLAILGHKLELMSDESWLVVQNRAINLSETSQRVPLIK